MVLSVLHEDMKDRIEEKKNSWALYQEMTRNFFTIVGKKKISKKSKSRNVSSPMEKFGTGKKLWHWKEIQNGYDNSGERSWKISIIALEMKLSILEASTYPQILNWQETKQWSVSV